MDRRYLDALGELHGTLSGADVSWALTGSLSFALQGVPVEPNDIDVQTTGPGAYTIEGLFEEYVTDPVSLGEAEAIRSHFGRLELAGVEVEVMGGVQKRLPDGTWEEPVDVEAHREYVETGSMRVPVLSLEYERQAYRRLGRTERAELLGEHLRGTEGE